MSVEDSKFYFPAIPNLPRIKPKRMGDGMKAKRLMIVSPKPIATVLSFSSTHLTDTRKFDALPVAPLNLRRQTTAKKM